MFYFDFHILREVFSAENKNNEILDRTSEERLNEMKSFSLCKKDSVTI